MIHDRTNFRYGVEKEPLFLLFGNDTLSETKKRLIVDMQSQRLFKCIEWFFHIVSGIMFTLYGSLISQQGRSDRIYRLRPLEALGTQPTDGILEQSM